jgi:hypothetical protein
LWEAARANRVGITQILLEHGADVQVFGLDALFESLLYRHLKVAELLLEAGSPSDEGILMQARNLPEAQYQRWLQIPLSRVNCGDYEALYKTTVKYGHTEFAEMLAEAHAEVTQAGINNNILS